MNETTEKTISLRSLQKRVLGIRITKRIKRLQIPFLLEKLQIRVEQNIAWILEGKEVISGNQKKDCSKYQQSWEEQSKLEGWKACGQRWICAYLETRTSIFRLSWLCTGTPISNREKDKEGIATL